MNISKKDSENIQNGVLRYQKILAAAKSRDLNESDTVTIITDILSDVFGYDKYLEITSELAIRNTFCDLAVKVNNKIEYLIECKSVDTELKDNHLKQAIDYGANQGVNWVILTNGIVWKLYKIRFEKPIGYDLVVQFDITALNPRTEDARELLYILHKSAIEKNLRQEHFEKSQLINPYTIAHVLISKPIIGALRREIRKLSDIKLDESELTKILLNGVVKRDLIESDTAKEAEKTVRKLQKSLDKKLARKREDIAASPDMPAVPESSPIQQEVPNTGTAESTTA
jgi:predicted type IV restriction endonuclease